MLVETYPLVFPSRVMCVSGIPKTAPIFTDLREQATPTVQLLLPGRSKTRHIIMHTCQPPTIWPQFLLATDNNICHILDR